MSGDQSESCPLTGLINDAKDGTLDLRMDLEKFVHIDRDCEYFKGRIRVIQRSMQDVSRQQHWGLGEDFTKDGDRDLVSAKTMVKRWKNKSKTADGSNNFYDILESHWQTVDDFQTLFRTVRRQITDHDTAQAAEYKQLESSLPQQSPQPLRALGASFK